jgi:hypothetical protein
MTGSKKLFALISMLGLLASFSQAQDSKKQDKKQTVSPAATSTPVAGSGTAGQITKWLGVDGSNTFTVGDTNFTEDKFGKVGIGTLSPTSALTVRGSIETTLGGFKFPDGSIQTTSAAAALFGVAHDTSLKGNGTVASPLGVAVPLILSGSVQGGVVSATNSGDGHGVSGFSNWISGSGVRGINDTGVGVYGQSFNNIAVFGESVASTGVFGKTDDGFGVSGQSFSNVGVYGKSQNSFGVSGVSTLGSGVSGEGGTSNFGFGGHGVHGKGGSGTSNNNGGDGVNAEGGVSNSGIGGFGVFARGGDSMLGPGGFGVGAIGGSNPFGNGKGGPGVSALGGTGSGAGQTGGDGVSGFAGDGLGGASAGRAGFFSGDVVITGKLQVTSGIKMFHIDHPLDPENKYLNHAAIESSEVLNVYSGNTTTDQNGDAIVTLPDWFEALNKDFRYQLTVIGTFAQAIVASEMKDNRFGIKSNSPNVKVSWQVTGVRSDATARMYKFEVEEEKLERDRGSYLNPDAYGQSEEKNIQYARNPEMMQRLKQLRLEAEERIKKQQQR